MHNYPEDKLDRVPAAFPLFLGIAGNKNVSIKLYSEENPEKVGFSFHKSLRPLVSEGAQEVNFYPINIPDRVKNAYKKRKKAA